MFAAAVVLSAAMIAAQADWVPARWPTSDPKTLELLADTPVNCLLLEQKDWSRAFNEQAAKQGTATLAVIRPGAKAEGDIKTATGLKFSGLVLEGDFEQRPKVDPSLRVIQIGLRHKMKLDGSEPVIGTFQGLWPGVRVEESGKTHTAASGSAWIDTNAGFLRFVQASTDAQVWIAIAPPARTVLPFERYLQAIGDAAMSGARWVLAFEDEFTRKLFARDEAVLKQWRRIAETLKYYESHPEWRKTEAYGKLALVQDVSSGALVSGGVLDMIAVKHTPVKPVPADGLKNKGSLGDAQLAVTIDPESLTPAQREEIRNFTRSGGTVLSGPPGWKFPDLKPDQITLGKEDLEKLDQIWREMNSMTGRRNLGARLYNVATMLSNLLITTDRKTVILQMVNYADYPVEDVTVHLLGKYASARLFQPGAAPSNLELYPTDEGMGLDLAKIGTVATVVLEPQL